MNKTILSIAVGVVFFLAFSYSNANVCTVSASNSNDYRETSQDLVTISNETNQCKFKPLDSYYIKDTYRTRNLNIKSENRRIRVNGKEQERRFWVRVDDIRRVRTEDIGRVRTEDVERVRIEDIRRVGTDDTRRIENKRIVRLIRSSSLPDIRKEHIRNSKDINFRNNERRTLERDERFSDNRFDEKYFRREVRDRRERQTTKNDIDTVRNMAYTRQNMISIKGTDSTISWPFSSFVQSAIGVLGLYYFGMQNKSTK